MKRANHQQNGNDTTGDDGIHLFDAWRLAQSEFRVFRQVWAANQSREHFPM
jgi:hypothetical protein